MALLSVGSIWLALSQIHCIIMHRKKYILVMCIAGICFSAMVEDISWYMSSWQPILRGDWTMMSPGLGLNFFGLTYIPLWYFVTSAVVIALYWLSNKMANKGYAAYDERQMETLRTFEKIGFAKGQANKRSSPFNGQERTYP